AADCQALRGEALLRANRLDRAAVHLAASLAVRRRIGEPLGVIELTELTACWLAERGRVEAALALLAGADSARSTLGAARLPRCATWVARLETMLVDALPDHGPATARRDGTVHPWPQLGGMAFDELGR
ncbi:MAG: hypothetical protein ABI039_08235, partial [Vicinamibacterales bacterium]